MNTILMNMYMYMYAVSTKCHMYAVIYMFIRGIKIMLTLPRFKTVQPVYTHADSVTPVEWM